jgi:protein-tyrosine phosphatase
VSDISRFWLFCLFTIYFLLFTFYFLLFTFFTPCLFTFALKMPSILFVCLGNICRSPLAEGILAHKISEKKLDWTVDSAGTGGWHEGQAADSRSILVAQKHGVDISKQLARQFLVADFDRFDRIFVMDRSNLANVLRLARNENDRQKVDLLLNLSSPGKNLEVPDPYYDDDGFEAVFQMIEKAVEKLF